MSGTISKVPGNSAAPSLADDPTDPNSPNYDPSADPAFQALAKNLRADQDASTGETDSQIAMRTRVNEMRDDGKAPVGEATRRLKALASVQSPLLNDPTQPDASLPSFTVGELDKGPQRA